MKKLVVRSIENDTVDKICYRYFGRAGAVTEQTLELNRHIADAGPVLPAGTAIVLPDSAGGDHSVSASTKLWD